MTDFYTELISIGAGIVALILIIAAVTWAQVSMFAKARLRPFDVTRKPDDRRIMA